MRYLHGKKNREIAAELGVNAGTASRRIQKAMEELRQMLKEPNDDGDA